MSDYIGDELSHVMSVDSKHMKDQLREWRNPTMAGVREAILGHRVTHFSEADNDSMVRVFAKVHDTILEAMVAGRAFDVGYLPNEVIKSEAQRAGVLYGNGHIGHPFRQNYLLFHTWEEGGALYLVKPDAKIANKFAAMEFFCVIMAGSHFLMLADAGEVTCDPKTGYTGFLSPSPARQWAMNDPESLTFNESAESALSSVVDPVGACMLLLATDGVEVTKVEASPKLNKARAKSRKPPIPPYWQVNTKPYVTALTTRGTHHPRNDGEHGSHRSPVPHIRRGHRRQLSPYHGGGAIWVRDALINLKDPNSPLTRSFYQMQQEGEKSK